MLISHFNTFGYGRLKNMKTYRAENKNKNKNENEKEEEEKKKKKKKSNKVTQHSRRKTNKKLTT